LVTVPAFAELAVVKVDVAAAVVDVDSPTFNIFLHFRFFLSTLKKLTNRVYL
jgi:hypothetical protein